MGKQLYSSSSSSSSSRTYATMSNDQSWYAILTPPPQFMPKLSQP